jgi:hypothetical protein
LIGFYKLKDSTKPSSNRNLIQLTSLLDIHETDKLFLSIKKYDVLEEKASLQTEEVQPLEKKNKQNRVNLSLISNVVSITFEPTLKTFSTHANEFLLQVLQAEQQTPRSVMPIDEQTLQIVETLISKLGELYLQNTTAVRIVTPEDGAEVQPNKKSSRLKEGMVANQLSKSFHLPIKENANNNTRKSPRTASTACKNPKTQQQISEGVVANQIKLDTRNQKRSQGKENRDI